MGLSTIENPKERSPRDLGDTGGPNTYNKTIENPTPIRLFYGLRGSFAGVQILDRYDEILSNFGELLDPAPIDLYEFSIR